LVLVGGVYDLMEQERWEKSRGWEQISALSRVMGGFAESAIFEFIFADDRSF
jgi:hypothetical protein